MLTIDSFIEGIRAGDRSVLGRAITLVESTRPDHREAAEELLEKILPYSGDSIRVGITGAPGVGKSTFIDAFGSKIIEQHGARLAVLAVDPSSQISGGSILGDKTRMSRLGSASRAFVRPSPSGLTPGGVARRTREAIVLCEAAGYDVVFVETVGVGQAETAVHSMVDFFLLLALAGAGDELQGIKRGIVEMADGIAITKADEGNEQAAERARSRFVSALRLFPPPESGSEPNVHVCSAVTGAGLEAIWEDIRAYERFTRESGYFLTRRREQAKYWFRQELNERLTESLYRDPGMARMLESFEKRVVRSEISASAAADAVLSAFRRSSEPPRP